jgi:hypothetical protein
MALNFWPDTAKKNDEATMASAKSSGDDAIVGYLGISMDRSTNGWVDG